MQSFQIHETAERTAWIYPEADGEVELVAGEPEANRVAIRLRYVTPAGRESYKRKLLQRGIYKRRFGRGGQEFLDDVPGKDAERYAVFVETFICGWQGFKGHDGQPLDFHPEMMARLMADEVWINKAISKGLEELDGFLASNGNGSSAA